MNYIESKRPGETLILNVIRDGKPLMITVKLAERPH
jgi:S1-C subfamily serine protease